jgi:hypothetical protein
MIETLEGIKKAISVFFQDRSKLTSHLTRIAGDLTNDVAFEVNVVARSIERHAHSPTCSLRSYNPGKTYVARVLCGHDLTISPLSDTPFGRACCVNDPLKFTAAGESG